jgi:hypothetical protein
VVGVSEWTLMVEPDGESTLGACPDCGHATRSVWGYVSDARGARAAYFIRWTEGHLDRGAELAISIGAWGVGATPAQRLCFGFECRMGSDRPGFMVVDAAELLWGQEAFLGAMLTRESALAHPTCKEVFAILDRLVEDDPRFRRFLLSGGDGRASGG